MINNRMLRRKKNRRPWAATTPCATTKPTSSKTSSTLSRNRLIPLILLILSKNFPITCQQFFNRSQFNQIWRRLWSQTTIQGLHRLPIRCRFLQQLFLKVRSFSNKRLFFFIVKLSSFLELFTYKLSITMIEGERRWNLLSHGVGGRLDGYTDDNNNNICRNRVAGGWQHRPEGNIDPASFNKSKQQRIRQLVTTFSSLPTDHKKARPFLSENNGLAFWYI